ncbi:Protein CBG06476 [Caenorhabditis briggsae]|uniref:Protein CBG06476 n=1 Tax=Caenorhabditis briggsae TaxID=6238 RepID=A8X2B2_CAEBR|nr:Protein CBG06476 [Caenorhabditis briggsae]CAP26772.1 Protein CBG06476 [Caenorhabditis briggsae]
MYPVKFQYCNVSETEVSKLPEKICKIQKFNLQNFETTCQRVIGNVFVGPGDEQYVKKLGNVTWIYGRIMINGTSLEAIDFFKKLEFVAYFEDDEYSLYILNNKYLINASFPNLKVIRTLNEVYRMLVFHGNNPQIALNSNFCHRLKSELNTTKQLIPEIDGKSYLIENFSKVRISYSWFLISILVTFSNHNF